MRQSGMRSASWSRIGGIGAMLGGACWVVKSVSILLTGIQPPLLFEIAPVLFALGLIGLHARIDGAGGRPATIGLTLAILSGGLAAIDLVRNEPTSSESFSAVTFGAFLASLAALIFLGFATRRADALPAPWRSLPLAMGVLTFPLLMVGGALESLSGRLLEVPLLVIAVAWIWTGYLILTVPATAIVPSTSGLAA